MDKRPFIKLEYYSGDPIDDRWVSIFPSGSAAVYCGNPKRPTRIQPSVQIRRDVERILIAYNQFPRFLGEE